MKKGKNHSLAIFFLVGASVIILLGGCGTDKKEPIGAHGTQAATVGLDVCASCHSDQTGDWLTSGHANLASVSDLSSTGTPSYGDLSDSTCETCHDPLDDGQRLTAGYTGDVPRPVVGCESCHGGGSEHYGGGPIGLLGSAAADEIGSSQFNTCTGCHELLNSAGTGTAVATHDASGSSPTTTANIVTDTHFATAGTFTTGTGKSNVSPITGYAMDFLDERVCTNCHNPHKPPKANKEWAQSKHADKAKNSAWAYYNWACDGTDSAGCGTSSGKPSNRTACQRCHTTSGFTAYADALRTGTTYTPPLAHDALFKPEMLLCTGCHTDNKGTLRNPGAITADYSYSSSSGTVYATVSYDYPDVSGSNICMACHTGRQSGESIAELSSEVTLTDFSFINSHYLAAGGTIFAVTGYEFSERVYTNPVSYMHDKIGSSAATDTGSNGPCVGCHMSSSEKHLFMPVETDSTGTIVSVSSTVCVVCHTGGDPLVMSVEMLENQKTLFTDAMDALNEQLKDINNTGVGYYFYAAHPYFYTAEYDTAYKENTADPHCQKNLPVKNWQTGGTTTFTWSDTKNSCIASVNASGSAGTAKNNMGAAFNYNLLEHDPGAYAHNRYYVKRLIYDSIDWLDNNDLDYSVGVTISGMTGTFKAGAMAYILVNGMLTNTEAERP